MGYARSVLALDIDPDIRVARCLPGEVYTSNAWFELLRERVFARTWHYVADEDVLEAPGSALPCTLLERCLDEPLALVRDRRGELRALSNVCTHRGSLVVEEAGSLEGLRCRYHGRRFRLDGSFVSMPETLGLPGFRSPAFGDTSRERSWVPRAERRPSTGPDGVHRGPGVRQHRAAHAVRTARSAHS